MEGLRHQGRSTKALGLALILLVIGVRGAHLFPQSPQPAQNLTYDKIPLQIIVVDSPEEAQHILEELKNGEDFAKLARKDSIDPTAQGGGYLGILAPAMLRPELRDALQGVGPGQVTRVIQIPEGYAVLRVMRKGEIDEISNADPNRNLATGAAGSVKIAADVSGFSEMEDAIDRVSKPAGWNQDPRAICEVRNRSVSTIVEALKHYLLSVDRQEVARPTPLDLIQAHYGLGQLNAYQGNMDQALEEYTAAYRIAASNFPAAIPQMVEALGIVYLHKSEMENDVYSSPGERCIFPMRPGNAFRKTDDLERAIQYFQKYLEKKPGELEVKWLLNLAYMYWGRYPQGVPREYLIPASAIASTENVGRFIDVASKTGIDSFSMAGGLIVDDFDNDGLLDVVTSSFDSCEPLHLFHNNGDGTFTNWAAAAGLGDQLGGLNIMQADYNNDGCLDILVLRGGWENPQRKSLLRNNCDGTFTDVTAASGLADPATATQTAVWADINNDGLLDLFVGSENGPSQLFLNKGNGIFENIAHSAGVDRTAFTKGVAAADYDNDGYVDFYVSNLAGNNYLYHNNHDDTFTEVAQQAGLGDPGRGFAAWFFDYDNDGWPDLFVTSYFISVDETVRTYLGLPHNAPSLKLYKNMGDGTFRNVTAETGLEKVFMPMGANFGDFDNDGFLDIYLGTGAPSLATLVPNVLLHNLGGTSFVDVTASSGTGELHKGHGVAFADIDNDGDEDLLEEVGGVTIADRHRFRLFENPGNGNDWITLKLVGAKSNRMAVGARIHVTVENDGRGTRSIYRTVGSGGSFGASPLQQHIGLGKSARIVKLETWWPASDSRQTFSGVGKNQFIEIKEFSRDYTKLHRRTYRLGGSERSGAIIPPQAASENTRRNK